LLENAYQFFDTQALTEEMFERMHALVRASCGAGNEYTVPLRVIADVIADAIDRRRAGEPLRAPRTTAPTRGGSTEPLTVPPEVAITLQKIGEDVARIVRGAVKAWKQAFARWRADLARVSDSTLTPEAEGIRLHLRQLLQGAKLTDDALGRYLVGRHHWTDSTLGEMTDRQVFELVDHDVRLVCDAAAVGTRQRNPEDTPGLTGSHVSILKTLAAAHPRALVQIDLEARSGVSRRTIGCCLPNLRTARLVRQVGPRKGDVITEEGLRIVRSWEAAR
jgi:hypothetical protein